MRACDSEVPPAKPLLDLCAAHHCAMGSAGLASKPKLARSLALRVTRLPVQHLLSHPLPGKLNDMRTASLFALALIALACSTSPEATPPPLPGSLSNGEVIGGQMNVESLLIPAGFTVWVESDLHLTATGPIRIEGQLVARDADSVDALDAPSIALSSSSVVEITGAVLGGRGAEGVVTKGGRGSSVVLTAPLVHIDGQVQAGSGGTGGPSLSGGSGGDALVHGVFNVRKNNAGSTLRSGSGGAGGFPGGSGGDSGAALVDVPAELRSQH